MLVTEDVPGEIALEIEEDILTWWRTDLGLRPYLTNHHMPQGGWTETVSEDSIDMAATIIRIRSQARQKD
ncbi:hypothetical protein DN069_27925 [Streptacidiphilus pinicola]|uniref:Uncharacterized protein n=1 Tax=Streptacidiphilus pinicola TaxID=2219663 RepID=A0A2X0IFG5_9ACTN|nr:hypothetical protein [Streptacidiphilus pinicola]RAG82353.1 hypothetical protein DN069_27925 [Streptacidiphilus pinicola]